MPPTDPFSPLDPPRTAVGIIEERHRMVKWAEHQGQTIASFTCDSCSEVYTCPLLFDLYNTDGDCLMEK